MLTTERSTEFPASYDSINRIILQQLKMLHNWQLIYRSLSFSSYSCNFSTLDHASTASHDFVTGSKDGSTKVSVLMKLKGCNVFSVADNVSFCERTYLVQHLGNRRISGPAYDILDQSQTINDNKGLPSISSNRNSDRAKLMRLTCRYRKTT